MVNVAKNEKKFDGRKLNITYANNYSGRNSFEEFRNAIRRYGVKVTLSKIIRFSIPIFPVYLYHKLIDKTFIAEERHFKYCLRLNRFVNSERIVEVPIVMEKIIHNSSKKCLEVGDTINNYYSFPHDVVDKYEMRNSVINLDIVDFNPKEKYDTIFSISTVEHIGFDETEKNPGKAILAINKMLSLLANHGSLIITVPLGYNPEIDNLILNNSFNFHILFLERYSKFNKWRDTSKDIALQKKYNSRYPNANSIAVIYYSNGASNE